MSIIISLGLALLTFAERSSVTSIHFQALVVRADKGACPAPRLAPPVRWLVESGRSHAPGAVLRLGGRGDGTPRAGPWRPPLQPSRRPAHAHARLHGRVAAGVRTPRSVEQRSHGAASTAAQEGSMSATRAKKVKMATKSCPECDQQVGWAGASGRGGQAGGRCSAAVGRARRPAGGGGLGAGTRRCPSAPRPARGPLPPRMALFAAGGSAVLPRSCRSPPPGWQQKEDKRTVMVLTFCKCVDFRSAAKKQPVLMCDF